ncbi:hypothetical protein HO173_000939 [Letharia columbiana]|uniref:Uncharacterized protein n=1 Tax=Letharia columbiana TaxID=112416 RepID=A0A8H6L9W1_9LECA|nr:uncharacterized protein HO173_000939 [Letharia columbiana]KAF6241145.1 hypothetical protein HO173_000939 [Letharia columbiana]
MGKLLLQKETQYYGVRSVGQRPIAPGKSFFYTFKADLYGTSWYHSHYSAQYAAGIAGPTIIYGPSNAHYDIDVDPVAVSDWYRKEYFDTAQAEVMADGPPPRFDNNMVNGKGDLNCIVPSNWDFDLPPPALKVSLEFGRMRVKHEPAFGQIVETAGFCSGILTAAVVASSPSVLESIDHGVDAFRLAFWTGFQSAVYCERLLGRSWKIIRGLWLYLV